VTIEYLADRREFVTTIAHWLHEEWGHLRPNETVHDRAARVERGCGHHEIPTTFVAVAKGQPVGCASLIEHDMLTRPELSPWLAGVFVPCQHRKRGIGADLVRRVVREARSLGVPRLYLYTPGSGGLYLRLGWSVAERTFYPELWGETKVTIMDFDT
jgi:N-acetylglutamate synthase-like GNAT family acetyltransferase